MTKEQLVAEIRALICELDQLLEDYIHDYVEIQRPTN